MADNIVYTEDYIVEEGTSGIWTYRKWASGIAECWGTSSDTYTIKNEWGSLYYSAGQSALAYYPFTFASKPICTYSIEVEGTYSVVPMAIGPKGTLTSTPTIQFCRATPIDTVTIETNWYAIGRWK